MEHLEYRLSDAPAVAQVACFRGGSNVNEYHLLVHPSDDGGFAEQLDWLLRAYRAALAALGLTTATGLFRRFFCNDLQHASAALAAQPLASRKGHVEPCAVSWVQQPPAPPARLALWAYHASDPSGALDKRLDGATLTWQRPPLTHCWTTGLSSPAAPTCDLQTRETFAQYTALLRQRRLTLAQHAIRTWLFIRDIDADYEAFATARRMLFREHGLTPDTHYIASTGIAGTGPDPRAAVTLDAYALAGVRPEQIEFLTAPDHMCPTHVYGVTFERGTAVSYRDRRHLFISGTASIDATGRLLHAGDLPRQLERALENVTALLRNAGADLGSLAMLLAYVRDARDQAPVLQQLRARCGQVPIEVVVAPICRPAWLVELEGIAITPATRPDLPAF